MPSGSEKDVLVIVAQQGGETTLGTIIRNMPCYSGPYVRSVVYSLGTHDYLDWRASGRIVLTDKGKKAVRLTDDDWEAIAKAVAEKKSAVRLTTRMPSMVGSELEALRKVKELRKASIASLSQEMNISTAQAALLLTSLLRRGYVTGDHAEGYELTQAGLGFIEG